MMEALNHQPIAVAVASNNLFFQFYSKGVLNSVCCGSKIDHAVLMVGYGEDSLHGPFWIVKNSWGPLWGENGYFRIARDSTLGSEGVCGINVYATYPII